jgi:hypothetical protein
MPNNFRAIFKGLFTPLYDVIIACGVFSAVDFSCISRQVLLTDLFYWLNEEISRSVAIGWIGGLAFSIPSLVT